MAPPYSNGAGVIPRIWLTLGFRVQGLLRLITEKHGLVRDPSPAAQQSPECLLNPKPYGAVVLHGGVKFPA